MECIKKPQSNWFVWSKGVRLLPLLSALRATNRIKMTKEQIEAYEDEIGMTALISHHKELRWNQSKGHKTWLALSPRELPANKKTPTKYKIGYWVNYGDDETFGWFTVEQIQEWLNTPDLLLYKLGGTRERIVHHEKN